MFTQICDFELFCKQFRVKLVSKIHNFSNRIIGKTLAKVFKTFAHTLSRNSSTQCHAYALAYIRFVYIYVCKCVRALHYAGVNRKYCNYKINCQYLWKYWRNNVAVGGCSAVRSALNDITKFDKISCGFTLPLCMAVCVRSKQIQILKAFTPSAFCAMHGSPKINNNNSNIANICNTSTTRWQQCWPICCF